jgi:hypothetical protein
LCNHFYKELRIFSSPPPRKIPILISIYSYLPLPLLLSVRQILMYFLSALIYLFWTFHTNGIKQNVVICDWFLSLSMFQNFISFYSYIIILLWIYPHFLFSIYQVDIWVVAIFCYCFWEWDLNSGLELAKEVLGTHELFAWVWLQTTVPPVSASK